MYLIPHIMLALYKIEDFKIGGPHIIYLIVFPEFNASFEVPHGVWLAHGGLGHMNKS